ncbi:DNA-binding response regulator [Paenibacillus baekrokdamisoli]|uniref:DNA-binding response regulator n=1 Tax=Paenibacillus baekrokdamisoli TaxID=1712516 RepID=A0A3G9IMI8_9BACL|nr:response regulator transcription factor [Paenibacillus baekrokdamisoli]MBB3072767.1 DNA-binding response OmpR family regulator [Paenibacillus baekrokdamisoli]BBH20157.1 DNA-binding response regulator [Paenibacillus baekrokdamisoli]
MQRIMICEDDPKLSAILKSNIEKYGYNTGVVLDFDSVFDFFQSYDPHLVLMDVNLPKYDGFYWCRQIRSVSMCQILFISARAGEMDQVMALECGADDYITKPFHLEVVMAKIRSQLRRAYGEYAQNTEERIVKLAGLIVYPERLELELNGSRAQLTKKEAVLLETLMQQFPRVVNREVLLDKLWDDQAFVDENTLNVNITRLRKKLQEVGIDNGVETARGTGYRLQIVWDSRD